MKKLMIIAASVLVAGIGAAGVTAASAANDGGAKDKAEMQALMGSKISITDAIKAAETAQPGKVAEAQFDLEKAHRLTRFRSSPLTGQSTTSWSTPIRVRSRNAPPMKTRTAPKKTA